MMSTKKTLVLCRLGGNFIWESNKVYYKGGTNRIVHIDRTINYQNLLSKVREIYKLTDISSIKYKYPFLDLDSLVSIENDDDISHMMEAFPESSEPIQLFVFCAQNHLIPIAIPSNLMQNVDNRSAQAPLQKLHESYEALASFSPNANANNNDVPSASNDLHSHVNNIPKVIMVLKEGQEFEDANAFHKALREYAIRSNFQYKRTKSGSGQFRAKCINDDCLWRIHACKLLDKLTLKIKSLGNHTCNAANESTMSNTTTHRQANRKWNAALVKDRLQKNLQCTPKDIVDETRREYGMKVSYDKAWTGKEMALKEIDFEQYVLGLMMLCKEIEMTNPGSIAKLSRSSDSSLRVFVAYKAAICGFKKACWPVVKLDHIKIEGKSPGEWLFAMAVDVNNIEFPVSCAFVESEIVGSWKWFCGELAQVLGCISELTFITDRREGILEVVSGFFPDACHQYHQRSLVDEICQKFECEDLRELLKRATFAPVHSEFNNYMNQIHDKCKEAWDFVKDIDPKHWATSHIEEKHYVYNTFFSDLMGHWREKFERWRELPIISVLVNLHTDMMERFNRSFEETSDLETILVHGLQNVISGIEKYAEHLSVSSSAAEFEVLEDSATAYKVDIEWCLFWQNHRHPCEHAIAAIQYSGRNVYDYLDVNFRAAKYRETYSEVIHPLTFEPKPRQKRKYGH